MKNAIKIAGSVFALFAFISLSGCNTMAGFSQDLQPAGNVKLIY